MAIKFYQVGGSVRDAILGVKSKDIDFAVEAESFDAMREAIMQGGGKIFLETPQYLTIRAHMPELGDADYVLCRKDGEYKDGRRPETVEVGTILDDLARRDFTMNAIAIDRTDTGGLVDPYDGQGDIKLKLIRCVGDAKQRFAEDKLRVFRAIRFAVTKGFRIEHATNLAIQEVNDFSGVSTERIRDELFKMFKADSVQAMNLLTFEYPYLLRIIQERDIWFKPTTEK